MKLRTDGCCNFCDDLTLIVDSGDGGQICMPCAYRALKLFDANWKSDAVEPQKKCD